MVGQVFTGVGPKSSNDAHEIRWPKWGLVKNRGRAIVQVLTGTH